jgi:hypothetical protein
MATKTPFHVSAYPGGLLGKFPFEVDAIRVAQMWSKAWGGWAEVINNNKDGGIIAQFDKGEMAPEFSANHADTLRPWLEHCKKAFA